MDIKPGKQFDEKLLKNPPKECEVAYSWNWNAPITKDGIIERLDGFVMAGIKCLYILPIPKDFRPERLRTFMDPEYLTPEFFELVSFALCEAKKRGIMAWIYDEGGWPSGGAAGVTFRQNPDAILYKPEAREITLECDERFVSEENFIALFDGKRRLPDNYIPSRKITLTAYYAVKDIRDLCRVDGTSETVTDTFIENTYEAYKSAVGDLFGDDIPLIFTDEPGLYKHTLAKGLYEKFIAEYGYDIRDYFYVITDDGTHVETEEEERARIDWATLTGKLYVINTFQKLHDWCEKNGVYYSGHLDLDNRPWGAVAKGYFSHIDCLRKLHVPGIDVIWEQIRYPRGNGAVDDETLGFGFFPRLASSAARIEGRNLALTETFSIYGEALTPDEIKFALNYQAIRGINVFNILALPYGKARCGALMMRPAFCPEKPGFYNLKHINEYYARLSYLLRLGHAEGDTALYHPSSDYAASPALSDEANVAFKAVGTSLEERNIPFDIIDDNTIRDAKDVGDGIAIGDAVYRHIAVPKNKYMPADVKAKIEKYIGDGMPTYTFENKALRVITRKLECGRLWFIFNEGEETVCEKFNLTGGKNIYEIDLQCAKITVAEPKATTLKTGDIAVFLVTDEKYATDEVDEICDVKLGAANITGYDRFIIEYEGIKSEHHDSEVPIIDENFSGTVYYEMEYDTNGIECDEYRISFADTSVSVRVLIDGEYACDLGINPMKAYVKSDMLKQNGKLTLAVSNTPSNEIMAKMDVITSHPIAEVGGYNPRLMKFETRRPPLRLGNVKLTAIKKA